MAEGRFTGKAAIVTGAGSGVGRAVAIQLAAHGASVTLVGRRPDPLYETAAATGPAAVCQVCPGSVSDEYDVARAVISTVDRFGGVDILVLAAGVGLYGPIESYSLADWNETMATNLTGAFLFSRAVVPVMRSGGGGAIVALGSGAGRQGYANLAAYSASKFGLTGLMQSIASEVGQDGIKVGTVVPGSILSDFGGRSEEAKSAEAEPGKHYLAVDDVADAVVTMLSTSPRAWMQEVQVWPFGPAG